MLCVRGQRDAAGVALLSRAVARSGLEWGVGHTNWIRRVLLWKRRTYPAGYGGAAYGGFPGALGGFGAGFF